MKEILEEIAMANALNDKICKDTENTQGVTDIELRNFQPIQSKPEEEVPTEDAYSEKKETKSESLAEVKEESVAIDPKYELSLSEGDKLESSCQLEREPRTEKSTQCKNNAKNEKKANTKENKSSHLRIKISDINESFIETRKELDLKETKVNIPETWTKVKNTKRNKGKEMPPSNKKKLENVKKQKKALLEKSSNKSENNDITSKITCRLVELKQLICNF